MAHLDQRNGIYNVRFRLDGREYKKSLKTRDREDAAAALHGVEQTLHLLRIGKLVVPPEIDAGDYVVTGGAVKRLADRAKLPSLAQAVTEYLDSMNHVLADTYHDSQRTHLGHFTKYLKSRAERMIDRVVRDDVEDHLQDRLSRVDSSTVEKERITLRRFFAWAVDRQYVVASAAEGIARLPSGRDLAPFRTMEEIEAIVKRGGIGDERAIARLWERLFLSPSQIADLLRVVRNNAAQTGSWQLHAVTAYTGMRRGEVLRLRWVDVSFEERALTAYSRKQSRRRKETSRRIDVHPELLSLLLQWREQQPEGQYVVADARPTDPLDKDKANRWFWQPLRGTTWCLNSKKNWFKLGFHTYRHSFASNMAAAGVDQRIIDEYMGHTTESMRRRYRHLFPRQRQAAIEVFSLNR